MAKKKLQPKSIFVIQEQDLLSITTLRLELEERRRQVRELETELKTQEQEVIGYLREGAITKGQLQAVISIEAGRCSPKWKDEYLVHMQTVHGIIQEAAEEEVKASYPPEPREKLVISKTETDQ